MYRITEMHYIGKYVYPNRVQVIPTKYVPIIIGLQYISMYVLQ